MEYNGVLLPQPFVVTAQLECIREIGRYNGETHKFFPLSMDPTRNSIANIHKAFVTYKISQSDNDFDSILKMIRLSGDTGPEITYGTISEDSLAVFDIVHLYEEDGSATSLLYLGDKEFFVLKSSKSSIIFKDILQCNTMPIAEGDLGDEFNVIRDGQFFSPEEFDGYKFPYCTKRITKVETVRSSEILRIIDENSRFGGIELKSVSESPKDAIYLLVNDITDVLRRQDSLSLPTNQVFPEYEWLLGVSKASGIRTFVLNALIEVIEARKGSHYAFVESDWKKSKKWEEEQEKIRHDKELAEYNSTLKDFKKIIGSLRQRRILLFFKAETRVSDETDKYINVLINKLEEKSKSGFGQSGYAASEYSLAKERTRPLKGENLKTGIILASVVASLIFVAISWIKTDESKDLFDKGIEVIAYNAGIDKNYVKAINACDSLYKAFRPSYTRMVVSSKYKMIREDIEHARLADVDELVNAIKSMREASRGRFNKYSEAALFRLLEIAPEDTRAILLKSEWMKQ